MKLNSAAKVGLLAGLILLGIILARFHPWEKNAAQTATANGAIHTGPNDRARQSLTIGFLPVTCHLTCPVTDFASKTTTTGTRFDSQRYTEFPPIAEAMKAGTLKATFMIVPLAMRLREQGVPIKICYLGHRDGSTVMVRKNDPAKSLRDLRGKIFAIPSPYSNQNIVIHKLMADQGLAPDAIKFITLPPPDMPTALASGAIDAYFVGEPHAAKAEMNGTGRVLYHAKDIWPGFISCALVVREDLIKEQPEVVRDLVRGVAESGEWAETHRMEAAKLVAPYYRQDEKLIEFVLKDPGRVSYRQLTPTDKELQQIADMALKMGLLTKPLAMSDLIDRQFIPEKINPASIPPQ